MNRYFWPDMPAAQKAPEPNRPVKKTRPYQARRVSIAAKNRREVFVNEEWKRYAEKSLLSEANRFGIKLLAYAFLPDRLELLAENPPDVRVFDRMLKFFMQDTEIEYKLRERKRLWLGNYFTKGVTVDDSLQEAIAEMQKLGAVILANEKAELQA
jgi:REP element-mobilizing transposase RayT